MQRRRCQRKRLPGGVRKNRRNMNRIQKNMIITKEPEQPADWLFVDELKASRHEKLTWGRDESSDYYEKHHGQSENLFNWIQIYPFKSPCLQNVWKDDHAGLTETSLMMAFCPEGVDMTKDRKQWYAKAADNANIEYGMRIKADIMRELRKSLESKDNS